MRFHVQRAMRFQILNNERVKAAVFMPYGQRNFYLLDVIHWTQVDP